MGNAADMNNPYPPDDSPVTSLEVCTALGVGRSTLTRWVLTGRAIPAKKLPGKRGAYIFTRTELDRLRETSKDAA